MPVDGPDSPPQATAEAPPSRRARRVTPDPGIAATAVADPLLAADAAAAEASNGDHPTDDTAPTPVVTSGKPMSASTTKQRKTAAAKAATPAAMTAAVEVAEPPPTEPVDVLLTAAASADTLANAATEAEAPASTTDGHATPSSGVPMVALVPPSALVEPPPTAPTPTVVAPTAATIAAAAVIAPVTAPTPTEPVKGKAQPKPVPSPKAKAVPRRRVRARRVQRIVRRVDAWSVMKVSFVFFIVLYLVFLVAGVLLWAFAVGTGTIDNVENFIEQLFALDSFSFVGAQILRASVIGGALLVIAGTFTTTVLAVLFNLISDLVGGVRFTVVEEQVLRPVAPARPPAAAGPSTVDGAPQSPGTV
ncbi:MAG TPA: DUF3566 domain-containing protein [Acidimicrobiales bacterium]|nr:DUF3566 domain-containing protein [Acidimicrobiales bacterium]